MRRLKKLRLTHDGHMNIVTKNIQVPVAKNPLNVIVLSDEDGENRFRLTSAEARELSAILLSFAMFVEAGNV